MELTGWQTLHISYGNREYGTGTPKNGSAQDRWAEPRPTDYFAESDSLNYFPPFTKVVVSHFPEVARIKASLHNIPSQLKPTLFVLLSSFTTSGLYNAHKNMLLFHCPKEHHTQSN